jgi:hypothetical protein
MCMDTPIRPIAVVANDARHVTHASIILEAAIRKPRRPKTSF